MTLIQRDPKEHHGLLLEWRRSYEDQVKNEVVHRVQVTMGLPEPQLHAVAILHLFPPLTHLTPWRAAGRADGAGLNLLQHLFLLQLSLKLAAFCVTQYMGQKISPGWDMLPLEHKEVCKALYFLLCDRMERRSSL